MMMIIHLFFFIRHFQETSLTVVSSLLVVSVEKSFFVFSPLQCCDLGYHASLNRALRTYLSAEYNLETSRHEGLDIIENAVDSLDPRSDRQRFMEMYPTAFCPPAKFEFQSHMGDQVCSLTTTVMRVLLSTANDCLQ